MNNRNGGVVLLGNPFFFGPPSPEDSLFAVVSGNDLSDNTFTPNFSFGLRIAVITTIDHGSVTATISNNRIKNNNLGVIMDAFISPLPNRMSPQLFTGTFDLTFEDNEIVGNVLTPALISFTLFTAALHPDAELPMWKYLERSIFDIRHDGELDGYWFDHPATDPIDERTLENVLKVNGDEIPNGRFIPFP